MNEEEIDFALLSLYRGTTNERQSAVLLNFLPKLIGSIKTSQQNQYGKELKAINDVIVFLKSHTQAEIPVAALTPFLLDSNIILQKNINSIFIKLGLTNASKEKLQNFIGTYIERFDKVPQQLQQLVFTKYLSIVDLLDPHEVVNNIDKNQSMLLAVQRNDPDCFNSAKFVRENIRCFLDHEELLITLCLNFEVDCEIPSCYNHELLYNIVKNRLAGASHIVEERAISLFAKLNTPIEFSFLINSHLRHLNPRSILSLLDQQITLQTQEALLPHIQDLFNIIMDLLGHDKAPIALRNLLKKGYDYFHDKISIFEKLFNSSSLDVETHNSIIFLYASFIDPSPKLMKYLEEKIWDGDSKALSMLRLIYPFNEARPRVIACILMGDTNFSDECRLLLSPYQHIVTDHCRYCQFQPGISGPSTAALFSNIIHDETLSKYIIQQKNTKTISTLFSFASKCLASYPVPYDFILECLNACPNATPEIAQFLVYISEKLPVDPRFNANPFVEYMLSETDPAIVEAIAAFLKWSNAQINIEEISEKLTDSRRIAFLSHFACPFDECFQLLKSGAVGFAKKCLMAIAKRKLLDKAHFDQLYPLLSSDAQGIEVLSEVAQNDFELCKQLTARLFEPPLISTERVEVVISGAKKMATIIDEDTMMNLIETALKNDKARRNGSIFFLYLINALEPKRLWFTVQSLLYCAGCENGITRTVGIVGINLLYRRSQNKDQIINYVSGKGKPEGESAMMPTGKSHSVIIQMLMKVAPFVPMLLDMLLPLIEPEFLIFPEIDIPSPRIDGNKFAPKFYYYSFNPDETISKGFRQLWRWATDGGKKISIPEIIEAIDTKQDSWDAQKTNMDCIQDVITKMTNDQMQQYFKRLSELVMYMVFSPVQEISAAGLLLIDKMVKKCGDRLKPDVKQSVMEIASKLFETRQLPFVIIGTKWCDNLITLTKDINEALVIYNNLFSALSAISAIPQLLMSDIWSTYSRIVYKCAELSIHDFMDLLKGAFTKGYTLDTQKYAVFFAFDAIAKAPNRSAIVKDVIDLMPKLFTFIVSEREEMVQNIINTVIYHSILCIYQGVGEVFDYDELLIHLYFEDDKPEILAQLLKSICLNCPDCLRSSITPLILLASCGEAKSKEFNQILRDEIVLEVQINSNPKNFVDFYMNRCINNKDLKYKPQACRALLITFQKMKVEIRSRFIDLVPTISAILPDRLWESKEKLIDLLSLLIQQVDEIPDNFVDIMQKQAERAKSVFRASAFLCLKIVSEKRAINKEKLLATLIDAMKKGTAVAMKAASETSIIMTDQPRFNELIQASYDRLSEAKPEELDDFCSVIIKLPEHKIPDSFDKAKFVQDISSLALPTANMSTLQAIIETSQ